MLPLLPARPWRLIAPLLPILAALPLAAQSNYRVSVDPLGGPSPSGSFYQALSADGAVVAFGSVSALVSGDANGKYDIYVHDRGAGTTVLASVNGAGASGDDTSEYAAIDPLGRFVAFESYASDLVIGDTNAKRDVFLRDLLAGTTERVNVLATGGQPAQAAWGASLSGNADRVAFLSNANGLVQGDVNGDTDVFVRDRVLGVNLLVSVDSAGNQADGISYQARISADGHAVAFDSQATNLDAGDTNSEWDVFVRDLVTGQTACLSLNPAGTAGNGPSFVNAISADGRLVSFTSYASDLVPGDGNGAPDVFVHDRLTGQTTRVSVSSAGLEGNKESRQSHISGDGRTVAFESVATNLAPGAAGLWYQVYVHDLLTGVTTRESVNATGQSGQSESRFPRLSHDGRFLATWSWAKNLVEADLNAAPDTFVRDRLGCSASVVAYCRPSTTSLPGCAAQVTTSGVPSLSAPAAFRVSSGAIPGGKVGVAFFGVEGASLTPVGTQGGLLCVGGTRQAAVPRSSNGTFGLCDGELEYGLDDWVAAQPGLLGPGATVHASFWFRDVGTPDGFGTSDGVWFQVCP